MNLRPPAVSGRFYPRDPTDLRSAIEDSFHRGPGTLPGSESARREIVAGVASNAGMVHCGPTSAYLFKALKEDGKPETFVIIGDNHLTLSDRWYLYPSGHWQTPMGIIGIDDQLTEAIRQETDLVTVQADVYGGQHSAEVHLPFLQYLFDDIRFVPIMTPSSAPWKGTEVGQAIARATKKIGRDAVVIASSSASMYYPFPETRASDRRAIECVTRMDAEGFVDQVRGKAWNGVAALEATIAFAKEMGAAQCSLLHFGSSYLSELENGSSSTEGAHSDSTAGYLALEFRVAPGAGWSFRQAQARLGIFLCHASNDKPAVRELCRRLKFDAFRPWLDDEQLLPGQEWDLEIRRAVRRADVVLVCLSRNSVTKEGYVQREIRRAMEVAEEKPEGTIFIVPVKLEECDVPDLLRKWQWVDLTASEGYSRLLGGLRRRALERAGKGGAS